MTFTPKLLEQYRECEKALLEASNLLQTENPDTAALSRLETILSADTNAMAMLKKHREYGQKVPVVLEKLGDYKVKPLVEIANTVEPVSDAEMIEGNWAHCVSQSRENNLEIAIARQIAELRMKHGKDSIYCKNGGWVAESFNYLPDGNILVALKDYNPLFRYAEEATNAHIAGKDFYLDDNIVSELLTVEKQGSVLLLKRTDVPDKISVDAFGKEPLTAFLGWNKDYGEFLNNCGIKKVSLYVANKQKQAFSRALWASYLSYDSALNGNLNLYNINGRAFGVRSRGEQSETGSTGPR